MKNNVKILVGLFKIQLKEELYVTFLDYTLIIIFILAAVMVGLYFFNRKNYKKVIEAQDFIQQNKMVTQVFVIDKKFTKPTPENMPKAIYEKLPKMSKMRKMALVKAKVGPQIVTLMCDKNIFDVLPTKKSIKIELAGVYIVNVVGMNLADKKKKTWREKIALKMQQGYNKK